MKHNDKLNELYDFLDDNWQKLDLVFLSIKEDLSRQFLNTTPPEEDKRTHLYYTAKAIDSVAAKLQDRINESKTKIEE